MTITSAETASDCPEFVVRREAFDRYFDPPLATSTFHDLVNKGKIIPMKGMRGFYLLNASLRRLGLHEVAKLPKETERRSLEDIVRLAFTLIDQTLFPPPSWLLPVATIDARDTDHARRIADQQRDKVKALDHHLRKIAYLQGVLGSVEIQKAR